MTLGVYYPLDCVFTPNGQKVVNPKNSEENFSEVRMVDVLGHDGAYGYMYESHLRGHPSPHQEQRCQGALAKTEPRSTRSPRSQSILILLWSIKTHLHFSPAYYLNLVAPIVFRHSQFFTIYYGDLLNISLP